MFKQSSIIAIASASLTIFAVAVPPAAADDTMWETLAEQIKTANAPDMAEQRSVHSARGVEGRRAPAVAEENVAAQDESESDARRASIAKDFVEPLIP